MQCSTCLMSLNSGSHLTSTPCGHIFHHACVIQWFGNKKNCPQCRHIINEDGLRRIYLTDNEDNVGDDYNTLQDQLETLQLQLQIKVGEKNQLWRRNQDLESVLKQQNEEIENLKDEAYRFKVWEMNMNQEMMSTRVNYQSALEEVKMLKEKLQNLERIAMSRGGGDLTCFLQKRRAVDKKNKDFSFITKEQKMFTRIFSSISTDGKSKDLRKPSYEKKEGCWISVKRK